MKNTIMKICPICNKEVKSIKMHHWKVHDNGKHHNPKKGKSGGNQFTARTKLNHSEETKLKIGASSKGRKHSEETKQKLSDIRKKYLEKNPDKVPYLLNHTSKISYPEQYFLECLSDIENIEFQYPVFRYKLDFANIVEKLYLEIDGEQHYVDKRIIEHDIKRTAKLKELGWNGFRIRWASFQKLTDKEKKENILEIRSLMKWLS